MSKPIFTPVSLFYTVIVWKCCDYDVF